MSKAYKRQQRLKSLGSMLYMLFISLLMLPLAWLLQKLWFKPIINTNNFFGMSINFDKYPQESIALVKELGLTKLMIRFRMDEIENIDAFKLWLQNFKDQEITINLIQDTTLEMIQLSNRFKVIFTVLSPQIKNYQVGTTINRSKWGFFSVNAYLKFFRQAHKLRKKFPDIKLYGPSVIDFEYHYTTQALFNPARLSYDGCSSLLYVDRTITPENKQFSFDLLAKINLLYSLVRLSPKSANKIIITETNWPIKGSGKYAPTSDLECVSEEDFSNYLIRYYLLALGSSKVETVYWHQLIAVGFGLVHPLEDFRKRQAFFDFKKMLEELAGASNIKLLVHDNHYSLTYCNAKHEAEILWTNDITITLEGKELSGRPAYFITKELS